MKKGQILACIGLAFATIPLSVSAAQVDITETKSSSIQATVESVETTGSSEGTFNVSWGDFKFNYSYNEANGVGSWTPVNEAGYQDVNYVPGSNEINVWNAGIDKDIRSTVTFNTNITGVSAQIFGETIDPKSGETEVALHQLNDGSAIVSQYKEVDYDVNLLGGDYESVNSEFTSGDKVIGTFTVTIEDAE